MFRQAKVSFKLPANVTREGDLFVSECPILDVVSQGRSQSEAIQNLEEAAILFLETCVEMGTLTQVLGECGFTPDHAAIEAKKDQDMIEVPMELLANESKPAALAHC